MKKAGLTLAAFAFFALCGLIWFDMPGVVVTRTYIEIFIPNLGLNALVLIDCGYLGAGLLCEAWNDGYLPFRRKYREV